MKIKRVYIHCEKLEEAPMWDSAPQSLWDKFADASAELMRESDSFMAACRDVITLWPNATIHNLSNKSLNRKAWIGHAACFLSVDSVEYTTRLGWRLLDEDEQEEANRIAQLVINEWELSQCQR